MAQISWQPAGQRFLSRIKFGLMEGIAGPIEAASENAGERGISLVSVLMGLGLASILAMGVSKTMVLGLKGQKKVEIYADLSNTQQLIAKYIDCDYTLEKARIAAGVTSNQQLCNANGSSESSLLRSYPLQIYVRTQDGSRRPLTEDLNAQFDRSGKIGNWRLRAACDWTNQSLVIRAAQKIDGKTFAKDPLTQAPLDWSNDKLLLFGGAPGQSRICLMGTPPSSTGAIVGTKVAFLDSRKDLTIDIPAEAQYTEIISEGQFQGTGDVGADVSATRTLVNIKNKTSSGIQMVKIGSNAGKSRSVFWNDAKFGRVPEFEGFANESMSENFRDQKMPNPLIADGGSNPDGSHRIVYSERVADPGKNGQRWWGSAVVIKHFSK
ncbi:MAG TPA: hypothetical protein VFO10_17080 [Oligoflexus sp.]|uniref:hypothetical protein n=1 Tax=Oligoflexus sp. TaxID=1971216 RepID=UPI002D7E7CD5|nr:hypothetical protein [Oligoflexus sp.]HET9238975.1 hypothetical protein [Oligoflexus sp.]